MLQKFIHVNDCSLSYFESNANKNATLFLVHGNSGSALAWRKQMLSSLLQDFRLVALELPAHGESDCFPDNTLAVSLPGLAEILVEAIQKLAGEKPFVLVGVSLATNIIAEMLVAAINPTGIVLAGPCIVGGDITIAQVAKPGTHVEVVFTDEAPEESILAYARETSLSQAPEDVAIFVSDYARVKRPFRSLLGQSIFAARQFSNEIALLQKRNIPLLVVFGADEQIVDPDYLNKIPLPLYQGTIFKLPGASHLVNIDQPEAFNQLLANFLGDVIRVDYF